jgi:hypothetical protein
MAAVAILAGMALVPLVNVVVCAIVGASCGGPWGFAAGIVSAAALTALEMLILRALRTDLEPHVPQTGSTSRELKVARREDTWGVRSRTGVDGMHTGNEAVDAHQLLASRRAHLISADRHEPVGAAAA